jgi:hypothetical protein
MVRGQATTQMHWINSAAGATGAVQARQGTWRREHVLQQPLLGHRENQVAIGLTNWTGRCPQQSRAMRVSAAREQCLEMMSCTPRALAGNLNREQRRDHAGNLTCYCPNFAGSPAGILGRAHGCVGCQELRSATWSTQLRAADGANRVREAAHRDAVAKGTSFDCALISHTQLLPALGQPASASRFPARTHPTQLKGPSCAHVHTALPGARRSLRRRAENK